MPIRGTQTGLAASKCCLLGPIHHLSLRRPHNVSTSSQYTQSQRPPQPSAICKHQSQTTCHLLLCKVQQVATSIPAGPKTAALQRRGAKHFGADPAGTGPPPRWHAHQREPDTSPEGHLRCSRHTHAERVTQHAHAALHAPQHTPAQFAGISRVTFKGEDSRL
jgi:hypothetical protein